MEQQIFYLSKHLNNTSFKCINIICLEKNMKKLYVLLYYFKCMNKRIRYYSNTCISSDLTKWNENTYLYKNAFLFFSVYVFHHQLKCHVTDMFLTGFPHLCQWRSWWPLCPKCHTEELPPESMCNTLVLKSSTSHNTHGMLCKCVKQT